jgi:hypothetical protein
MAVIFEEGMEKGFAPGSNKEHGRSGFSTLKTFPMQ